MIRNCRLTRTQGPGVLVVGQNLSVQRLSPGYFLSFQPSVVSPFCYSRFQSHL
jgi:hypothetical protein